MFEAVQKRHNPHKYDRARNSWGLLKAKITDVMYQLRRKHNQQAAVEVGDVELVPSVHEQRPLSGSGGSIGLCDQKAGTGGGSEGKSLQPSLPVGKLTS